MSQFPVPEHVELRRFSDAIATRELGLPRPLAFMTPAERVRVYNEVIEPMIKQLARLHLEHESLHPPTFIVETATRRLVDVQRQPMTGDTALLANKLIEEIAATRAQILGGLEP